MPSNQPLLDDLDENVAHHPRIGDIRDLLTFRVAMLGAAGDRIGQQWLGTEFGFRIVEWRVLGIIAALQPVRFFEVARTLLIDKGQLSRIVNLLTKKGFVEGTPDPDDQRTIRLCTTDAGAEIHRRILRRAFERNQLVVSALTPGELETLFSLLDKLQPLMSHRATRTAGEAET
ncbi:MarR family winged helix-turn-helix transcriptional regulator [uncultured Nitratireductor sp.]|uniref:MarR family winged helix-turn-helix transcriptional regulator n=1 Tax=uncultured Nitratireductor sp. TaxID=520953 RepID=UPI0025F6E1A9|nr:MarR family winged helix-turn-helix transcriptional regulator [uncultured Nitratireductor sp.]